MNKYNKKKILISACLLGEETRYDGKHSKLNKEFLDFLTSRFELIPICPEVLGGLSIPRIPAELNGDKVVNRNGEDVTSFFEKGFEKIYDIVFKERPLFAILKEKSPSCGVKKTYDGSFSGTLIEGSGYTTSRLKMLMNVYSEDDIQFLIEKYF